MLDFIKKLIGKNIRVKNPSNVPDMLLELIHSDIKPIEKLVPGLADKLFAFVVDGEYEEALLDLAALDKAAEVLHLREGGMYHGYSKGTSAVRRGVIANIQSVSPEIVYRLARVFHSGRVAQKGRQKLWPDLAPELEWLEDLIYETWVAVRNDQSNNTKCPLPANMIAAVLKTGGHSSDVLAELFLFVEDSFSYNYHKKHVLSAITDLGSYFAAHSHAVIKALGQKQAQQRAHVLSILTENDMVLTSELVPVVCEQGVASAKTVRAEAEKLLNLQPDDVKSRAASVLEDKAANGSAAERVHAVNLLVKVQGDACLDFLRSRLDREKAKKVVAEIETYLMISSDSSESEGGYEDGLDPGEPQQFHDKYEISQELEKDLLVLAEKFNEIAIKEHAKNWDRTDPRWRRGKRDIKPPLQPGTIKLICKGLQDAELVKQHKQPVQLDHYQKPLLYPLLAEFVKRYDLGLVPIIRLGFMFNMIHGDFGNAYWSYKMEDDFVEWIAEIKRDKNPGLSLLDIASAFQAAGLSERSPAKLYFQFGYAAQNNPLDLTDDEIWPFFHVYAEYLEGAFGFAKDLLDVSEYFLTEYRRRAYQLLRTFPMPPKKFVAHLWEKALGTSKTERPLAQACLINYPEKEKLIIAALEDGRKDVRAAAAGWLGELKVTEAEKPIRKALDKEKYDEAKAAMMESLEILGADIDRFLNRKKLLAEAEKGLKKNIHKDLVWFPFERLPTVHWEKNKQTVAPEIIKWFVVQTHKLKNPDPGPLHRRYFHLMHPEERKALGKYVLEAWLAQDTIPKYNHEEASKRADADLAQYSHYAKQHPEYYPDFNEEQVRKNLLNHYLNECLGSANSSKGILAISAACCGPEAVEPVEKYLKKWFGHRMAQCKALLRMLSWVDHPLAIQLILSTATRFRTRGIQKEAVLIAEQIAERKGWTLEEMADRTIPTAGFDINGVREIDYGLRTFSAKLMADFSIQLENQSGKVIKSLPAANKAENEDEIKSVKKDFSAARKEIKQVLKHQKERLYEAMCTERTWRFEDWDMYLNNHPIVSRYCRRLVWMVPDSADSGENGEIPKAVGSFRPTSDRTLTDFDDEQVTLDSDQLIQIAHHSFLSREDCEKWREHLSDYEIEPLFEQFRESDFMFEIENNQQREIKNFEGYLVNSYKLRSRTNKLGYTRGMAEDGGWFYTYHKNFPGRKLQAVIQFTGNVLPEEDRTVGLVSLYFTRLTDSSQDDFAYSHRPVKLADVPAVMLMECANDLKQMADDGSGFDKDWEKKTEY